LHVAGAHAPQAMKQAFWKSSRAREFAVVYHREILESLRAHDAVRADAVMRSHVFAVKDFFTEHQRHERLRNLVEGPPGDA
jgi:DNA-binding FadR family transcriptional regulator